MTPNLQERPMETHSPHLSPEPSAGHETTDVRIGAIVLFFAGLAVTLFLAYVLLMWLFDIFAGQAELRDPQLAPFADTEQVPPQPHLQAIPRRDLEQFRHKEEQTLQTYGWVDRKENVVRLPIGQAMKLLVERGLPEPKPVETKKPEKTRREQKLDRP
jgi:hypothetical protein